MIIDRCIKNDRKQQQQLYEFTYTSLAVVVSMYTKDDSERDWVFNTGMLKIFDKLPQFEKNTNYLGWARSILVYSAIDHYRKNKTSINDTMDVENLSENNSFVELNHAISNIETETIITTIKKLPKNDQTVFNLSIIEGYTHKEIADLTGINENTSKWLLNRAKQKLQKLLSNTYTQ